MPYGALADAVLILHLCFILFVVLGGVLVLRWPWLAWLHLPAAVWGALVEIAGWICPLTPLEVAFRQAAGRPVYDTSFIEHYLVPIIYPSSLTRDVQIALGVLVLGLNVAVYGFAWWARFGRKR